VGILATAVHARGKLYASLMTEAPASRQSPRLSEAMLEEGQHFPYMDGKTIFKQAVKMLPKVAKKTLEMAGISKEDVDLYIPHQANLRINQFFQELMKLEEGKVFHNIQRYGNTTAGSIPIALDEALELELIGPGSTICMLGFGAGLTWGSIIYRFPQ
jgi:3-oxoacyl-[acyl-carrier-protein] synthase-3